MTSDNMEEKKSLFFYPNVCHVCKVFPRNYELKRCGGCRMIFYCNNEHQKIHWPQHKHLCKAVRDVLSDRTKQKPSLEIPCYDRKNWIQKQMNLMLLVGLKLNRHLEPYEEQMFKFAKVCTICYDENISNLEDCKNCASTSFCIKHKGDITHTDNCFLLKLCFELDVTGRDFNIPISKLDIYPTEYILVEQTANIRENVTENVKHKAQEKDIGAIPSFGHGIYDHTINYAVRKEELPISERAELAYTTEIYTRPFCILHTIKYLNIYEKSNMIIHVVGANMIEMANLETWEILLHILPSLKTLRIVMIGPELPWSNRINIEICEKCLSGKKDITIDTQNLLYKDYELCQDFEKPNIIIAYNAGIHECEDLKSDLDTWAESLHSIAKQKCPFVVTSYTLQEAQNDISRIASILGIHLLPTCSEKCPYSSVRPHRDFESGGVFYQNQYITIYKTLDT